MGIEKQVWQELSKQYKNIYKRNKKKPESAAKKGETAMKKTYKIDVDCANCANLMEEAARKTEGVKDCSVSFMTLKMKVEFDEGIIQQLVKKMGFR